MYLKGTIAAKIIRLKAHYKMSFYRQHMLYFSPPKKSFSYKKITIIVQVKFSVDVFGYFLFFLFWGGGKGGGVRGGGRGGGGGRF